jgi:hypothetical protein
MQRNNLKKRIFKILRKYLSNKEEINQENLAIVTESIVGIIGDAQKPQRCYKRTSNDIIKFMFYLPFNCITSFTKSVFGDLIVLMKKYRQVETSMIFIEMSKAVGKIIFSSFLVVILYNFALGSLSPAISILLTIFFLGFMSKSYSRS